ncbi:MAG: hypothetical protein ILP02_01205, partial [Clostridia bacterium]|nr:hypothetical protein [Clostridia bacterium]
MRKNHDVENSRGAFEGGRSAYEKLIKRIALKAWILSFVWGALVGLSVNLIVAAVAFMLGGGLYWLGLIAALVFTALFTVIFHRYRFNPTSQKIARVIDDLGLEERMITMEELKNDTSFIAKAQREDAMKTVNGVKAELLAITVPIAAIIAVSSVFIPSASMSVLSVLAANDVISGGSEIIEEIVKPEPVMVEVSYEWDGGGVIEGELFQVVEKGEDCTPVFAVA